MNNLSIRRLGDKSPVVRIEFTMHPGGISICVHPDKTAIPTRESISFCSSNAGGRSPNMYRGLAFVEEKLNAVGESAVLEGGDGRIVFLRNTGDNVFVVKTDSLNIPDAGELYGTTVYFSRNNPDYELVHGLFEALKRDHEACPLS